MSEYAFRKIDIDALDEDVLLPTDLYDPDPRGPDGALGEARARSTETRGLVSKLLRAPGRIEHAKAVTGNMALACCAHAGNPVAEELMIRGDIAGALSTILTDPPYGDGVDEAKALTTSAVLLVLNSTRAADIPAILKGLAPEQQDRLMAYLYKGMASLGASADVSGSVLLTWHEKLTEVAGVGCIVRVMTDRRAV